MAAVAMLRVPTPSCSTNPRQCYNDLILRQNMVCSAFRPRNTNVLPSGSRCRGFRGSICRLTQAPTAITQEAGREVPKESHNPPAHSRVVIIGASMAGLTAAAALSQEFDEVILLERDSCSNMDGERRGVPQYNQPHVLLLGGKRILEKYSPGFESECAAKGAVMWDLLENMVRYDFGSYMSKAPPGHQTEPVRLIGASRGFVEGVLRKRVLMRPNVSLRSSSVITGLTFSKDGSRVTGVVLKDGSEVLGDLVVDAAGRASKLPQWLRDSGVHLASPEVVNAGLHYASRRYRRPADWPKEKLAYHIGNKPHDERVSILVPIENDEWQIVLCGRHPHVPPTTEDGFLRWIQGLPTPDIFEAVSAATPMSPITTYSRTENTNNHLESADLPDGLVAIGDSSCSFNPIYGQGMTVAVKGVDLLAQAIHDRWKTVDTSTPSARRQALKGLPREFQAMLAAEIAFPWKISTGDDIRYLRSAGVLPPEEKSLAGDMMNWYMDLAISAAMEFWRSNLRLVQVLHMVEPASTLFHPDISLRVLQLIIRDAFARPDVREDTAFSTDPLLKSS